MITQTRQNYTEHWTHDARGRRKGRKSFHAIHRNQCLSNCATIMQTRCNRREQIVKRAKKIFYNPKFIYKIVFLISFFLTRNIFPCFYMCSGNVAPITETIKREGILDTYLVVIKIIGATIKVLTTQRIRTITIIYDGWIGYYYVYVSTYGSGSLR